MPNSYFLTNGGSHAAERLLLAHGRRASAPQRDCLLPGGYPTRQRGSSEPSAATESDPKRKSISLTWRL
jgi:hypothetical protein